MQNPFSRLNIRQWIWFILVALLVIISDQLSKFLILKNLLSGESITIIPHFFNLVLAFNPGAAFGMLADLQDGMRQIVLGATTIIALSVVFYFLLFEYHKSPPGRVALAMIFGGALGNIIDRARIGMVVDFLDFYIKDCNIQFLNTDCHWPAFNIADSSICIAVFILLFQRSEKVK